MNVRSRTALALVAVAWATQALAQVTFYEHEGYQGRSFTTERQIASIERRFNNRASSAIVTSNRWEVCEDADFGGRCATIAGAVIGGILGHQVGGGSGKQIATVGGAVAGGAIGARIGRDNNGPTASSQNVQRCTDATARDRPDHWDVTYTFRGRAHRVQMTSPPGATVTVNRNGEPRA